MRGRGEGSIRQRRRADGTVYWEARVRINGPQVSFYADSKSGAQAMARQARADAERGVATRRDTITLEAYLLSWLGQVAQSRRARTFKSYREHCEQHLIPAFGHVRLLQLTPGHVERLLGRLLASGLSDTTVTRVRATLSVALNQAMRDYGLPRNVASLARVPKSDRPAFVKEVVTPDQARAILSAFQGHRLEPLVLFSIATGVRQGELLALRWQDVDLAGRTVTITHAVDVQGRQRVLARPKSARSQRTLRLPDMALAALILRREQEVGDRLLAGRSWQELDLVFPGRTGGIRAGPAVTKHFQDHLRRHGLPTIRWHALRRVFAALLQDEGVPLERIRDLMGHSTLHVTEGYAYTLPESLDRDMGAIDRALQPNEGRMRVQTGEGD
jgi:integrase